MRINVLGYDQSVTSNIKEIDEEQFYNIVKYAINLDVDEFDIYEELYKSKNNVFPDSSEKDALDYKLNTLKQDNPLLETEKQGQSYEWVYINKKEKGEESFRYYFGINPMNMYKLVEKLTEKFITKGIPVSFKYQQESKKKLADRIILYTSYLHKEEVENVINEVYNENNELFFDSEKALPWIYESNTPNVYIAPESSNHEKSYGERFASALIDSKKIFHYLFQEDKIRNEQQLEMFKKIVLSTMLRNGIFLSKDNKRVLTVEQGITTFYNKENNILRNVIDDKNTNYYEVEFDSSLEGKNAFLNNFYFVKSVTKQQGVQTRVLSREQRNREIWNYLYAQPSNNIHI